MSSLHQVNHPGRECNITYRSRLRHIQEYYFYSNSETKGVRLWNATRLNGKPNSHKRKYFFHPGIYVDRLGTDFIEQRGMLKFWGEYEGHSEFELLDKKSELNYWDNPSAIHRPFFCKQKMQDQNTDPFIFGDKMLYATCKKRQLKNIKEGDIILFGSEFGKKGAVKFYLDTLLVIQEELPALLDERYYNEIYQQSTLIHLGYVDKRQNVLPVHLAKKFCNHTSIFSFFPAVIDANNLHSRPVIDTQQLGLLKPGARTGAKSKLLSVNESLEGYWKFIAESVLSQGFVLGIHADPLPIKSSLP